MQARRITEEVGGGSRPAAAVIILALALAASVGLPRAAVAQYDGQVELSGCGSGDPLIPDSVKRFVELAGRT